jgi:hypothetical protein
MLVAAVLRRREGEANGTQRMVVWGAGVDWWKVCGEEEGGRAQSMAKEEVANLAAADDAGWEYEVMLYARCDEMTGG